MKIADIGEFGLIDRIRRTSRRKDRSLLVGIGDDAAVVRLSASRSMLVTTDLLLEDVHFDLSYTDYRSLGWKSAAVNISDIAAMGGTPRYCLTALGIPKGVEEQEIVDFYRGFTMLMGREGMVLIGGDTCASRSGLFISVTAIGEARASQVLTRSGARPGDAVFVTGTLGDAAAGLELLQSRNAACGMRNEKRKVPKSKTACAQLVNKHLRPVPRVKEGRAIALSGCASAMIDVSDGLSSDLAHICTQSGVGAELDGRAIPVSASLKRLSHDLSRPLLEYGLHGGEDYELLFTVPENRLKKFFALEIPASRVGTIRAGKKLLLTDSAGSTRELHPRGYDHFANARK